MQRGTPLYSRPTKSTGEEFTGKMCPAAITGSACELIINTNNSSFARMALSERVYREVSPRPRLSSPRLPSLGHLVCCYLSGECRYEASGASSKIEAPRSVGPSALGHSMYCASKVLRMPTWRCCGERPGGSHVVPRERFRPIGQWGLPHMDNPCPVPAKCLVCPPDPIVGSFHDT